MERISWSLERARMRFAANNVLLHIHPSRVPASSLKLTYTWGLGGISTLLAIILGFSGILLMFRYEPSVERAFLSVQQLETQVMFGSLIRAVHHWSANALLIVAFLHLLRVFFTGGYKDGRGVNWLIGVLLLLVVLMFNFTGYLLPWDQLAFWAITVGTSLLSYLPVLGPALRSFFIGGPEIGQVALNNFYAIHVALLPGLMVPLGFYHFWKIRKNGGISTPKTEEDDEERNPVIRVTSVPNLIQIEFAAISLVLAALLIGAMYYPAPLGDMANPIESPNPAKAAWYFLGIQELLLHIHPRAAMSLIGVLLAATLILPWMDRANSDIGIYFRSKIGIRTSLMGIFTGLYLIPTLVVLDEFWTGPAEWFSAYPVEIASGWVPLLVTLLGLVVFYSFLRLAMKANHSEALLGLFSLIFMGFLMLTIIGIYFRGQNMALVIPFL